MTFHTATSVLAIDVGNTRAKFGLFRVGQSGLPYPVTIAARVLSSELSLAALLSEWTASLHTDLPEVAMIAGSQSVERDQLVGLWPLKKCQPILVDSFDQLPISIDVDQPELVGIDRLLDTFAAWVLAGRDKPVIAVDSGTATTVDLMTADGVFRGGSILPGLRLSAIAMHDYTAKLPLIDTDQEMTSLPAVPGRNTIAAMQAGLFIGQLGAVRELISRLTEVCPALSQRASGPVASRQAPALFISGGGGRQLVQHLPGAHFVDSLALHGLALIAAAGMQSQA